MRLVVAALLVGAALLRIPAHAAEPDPAAASFDYLHVEANEGSASGGHVAIRFGGETYHFQYHPEGVLRLHRDDSAGFLHAYGGLQNRDVHVQQIRVTPETRALLRRHFNDRFLLEERQFAILAALRADRDLLAAQAAARAGGAEAAVDVPSAGFFADGVPGRPGAGDVEPLAALRARIAARHGELLARREAATRAALVELLPVGAAPPADLAPHRYPVSEASFAQRAAELLAADAALDVLRRGAPLRTDVVRVVALPETDLTREELDALRRRAAALETRLVALAASSRPDWGSALLLGMARLVTLARSIDSGRLVVLDAYPEDATTLSPEDVRPHARHLPALLDDARADLTAARRALAADGALGEAQYTALETAANRFLELQQATARGTPLRIAAGPLLPARSSRRPVPSLGALGDAELHARLAALQAHV
ncbi:MAG: hypothetical protein AB1689_20735, partial [Thermodesulfobacteriota bacterium]